MNDKSEKITIILIHFFLINNLTLNKQIFTQNLNNFYNLKIPLKNNLIKLLKEIIKHSLSKSNKINLSIIKISSNSY